MDGGAREARVKLLGRSCRAGFAAKRDVEFDNNVTALDRAIGLEPGTLCIGATEFASMGIIQLCSALRISVIRMPVMEWAYHGTACEGPIVLRQALVNSRRFSRSSPRSRIGLGTIGRNDDSPGRSTTSPLASGSRG